jgi:hypothetical protein
MPRYSRISFRSICIPPPNGNAGLPGFAEQAFVAHHFEDESTTLFAFNLHALLTCPFDMMLVMLSPIPIGTMTRGSVGKTLSTLDTCPTDILLAGIYNMAKYPSSIGRGRFGYPQLPKP